MNTLKTYFVKYNALYLNLFISISFAFTLLLFRIKITHSYFYVFLVWNLFLASIPFLITQIMKQKIKWQSSKIISFLAFSLWLLFLPNSPYIITDLVHLQNENSTLLWLDLFLVFVFALNGLLLGLLSLKDMYSLLVARFGKKVASITIFQVCLLSGYGIYLGRFLRFNSWDILTNPKNLFLDIIHSIYEPKVWLIVFAFGGLQWILFKLMQSVVLKEEH